MRTGKRPYAYTEKTTQRWSLYSPTAGAPGDVRGLLAAMRRFLEARAVRGTPETGLIQLQRYLRDFIEWSESRGISHPQQVSRQILERYQRHLHHYRKKNGDPLSIVSQKSKVAPVRAFFKWLTRQGEIPANPAADLDTPRHVHRIPRQVLSEAEAQQVLALADTQTLVGLRDRAIMEVLYATGMRRMEIAHLDVGDIDAPRGLVLIRQGKNRKDRLIPLGQRALYWVERYLQEVRPHLAWNDNVKELFLGQEGHALSMYQLSKRTAAYVKAAKVGKVGGCHLWRHSMATAMLENGAELRFIQAMLGHSALATTEIYTHVAVGMLTRVHAQTHPGVALPQRLQERLQERQERQQRLSEKTAAPLPDPWSDQKSAPDGDLDAAVLLLHEQLHAQLDSEALEEAQHSGD
jgi:integrase/recombinase XerD